jgi:hypothetical protein
VYTRELFLSQPAGGYNAPRDNLCLPASTEVVPATTAVTANKIRPLTSPPPMPEFGGTPIEAGYAPAGLATVHSPLDGNVQYFCQHCLPIYIAVQYV